MPKIGGKVIFAFRFGARGVFPAIVAFMTLTACRGPVKSNAPDVEALPLAIQEIPIAPLPYNRREWGGWIDADKDCQNTRQELLIAQSRKPVTFSRKTCTVKTGEWVDFYTGEIFVNASELEVDHVVPVKLAHELGGYKWTREQKREFYNDLENLVLTSVMNNRTKRANDITMWQPAKKGRACAQANRWKKVKLKYDLPITKTEHDYLKLLDGCREE